MGDEELLLQIFRSPDGQWSGRLLSFGAEIGEVSGYGSAEDVEHAASESGIIPDRVEIILDEKLNKS
jgi:hypothetical protein